MTKITCNGKEVNVTSNRKEEDFAIDMLAIFSTIYQGTYFKDNRLAVALRLSIKDIIDDIDNGKSYLKDEYSIDMKELWKQIGEM